MDQQEATCAPRALLRTIEQSSWQLMELNSWMWKKKIKERPVQISIIPEWFWAHPGLCPRRASAEASHSWGEWDFTNYSSQSQNSNAYGHLSLTMLYSNFLFVCLFCKPLEDRGPWALLLTTDSMWSCADPAINLLAPSQSFQLHQQFHCFPSHWSLLTSSHPSFVPQT